jgi:hypothetical protein
MLLCAAPMELGNPPPGRLQRSRELVALLNALLPASFWAKPPGTGEPTFGEAHGAAMLEAGMVAVSESPFIHPLRVDSRAGKQELTFHAGPKVANFSLKGLDSFPKVLSAFGDIYEFILKSTQSAAMPIDEIENAFWHGALSALDPDAGYYVFGDWVGRGHGKGLTAELAANCLPVHAERCHVKRADGRYPFGQHRQFAREDLRYVLMHGGTR